MKLTTIARAGMLVYLLMLQGCGKTESVDSPAANPATVVPGTTSPSSSVPVTKGVEPKVEAPKTPREVASSFLKSLNDGSPSAALMSDGFKSIVAPPVFESDKVKGYSEDVLNRWLEKFAKANFEIKKDQASLGYFRGDGTIDGKPTGFLLGVKGDRVAWFNAIPGTIFEGELPPDQVGITVAAFAEALLANEWNLVEALFTDRFKAEIAPPFASDAGAKYNRGMFQNKLKLWKGEAQTFELTTSKNEGTIVLPGATPKKLQLQLSQSADQWLIDRCEVK
jgi:hypothetical protein